MRRLPVVRTYAAFRDKVGQVEALKADKQQRARVDALRAQVAQLEATATELEGLRHQRVAPLFNRAVLFDTSNFSYRPPPPAECARWGIAEVACALLLHRRLPIRERQNPALHRLRRGIEGESSSGRD